MKTQFIAGSIGALLCVPLASAAENMATVAADRISVFKVPLVCPAAPQIGCGSASKPTLLDLEKQPGVIEAWLNRAGTRIAIVWKADSDAETRRKVAAGLREGHATELDRKSRDETVADFLSGKGWYRGSDVDRLSEEEAGIIAARLVKRVQTKGTLPNDKAERLRQVLTDSFRKMFTQGQDQNALSVQELAGDFLDEKQIVLLKEAIQEGVRPLPEDDR